MPRLPTGTVTFLFTDIEGSTRLWEQHPDAMHTALARHDAILRAAIEAHGGHVFKTIGDAFCAAFDAAPAALDAALTAQLALQAEEWNPVGPLRVRMALHSGAAEQRAGDYFGPPLNRASRLLEVGHGGQILLTLAAEERVRDTLPEGSRLRILGEHRLKDLASPERVFQLLHSDLPAEFLPLRSLNLLPHNLPLQVTSFVGREKEMAGVRRLLARTRLLTLTGVGGTGKTRLALQEGEARFGVSGSERQRRGPCPGADLLGEYAEGVWLVELAPLSDPALVPQTMATVLGVREEPGRPLTATLVEALKPRKLLVLLDNCEHLLSACAHLADALLRACPGVQVLATSREGLNIPGETAYRLPSLSVPDPRHPPATVERLTQYEAVHLFLDRAATVAPGFTLTDTNAPSVAQVCCRLDGIPLAIELAAARVKVLSVEKIAQLLDDRFRLLTGGSRTALPRQQTLRALIDWSYDLLSEPERRLLGRLAVFSGGWTLEVASSVGGGDPIEEWEVLDLLTALVEKSLAVYEEQTERYRLLETVRQYARDRLLESGEGEAMRERHRDYFLTLAEAERSRLNGPEQIPALDRLEWEHDNLRTALAWSGAQGEGEAGLRLAAALEPFWGVRGYLEEGREHLAGMLRLPGAEAHTAVRAGALEGAGWLALGQGDNEAARALWEESLTIYRELENKRGIAGSLKGLGLTAERQGDRRAARALFEESLTIFREIGNKRGIASSLAGLGWAAYGLGEAERARALFEESVAIHREIEDKPGIAWSLNGLGWTFQLQGEYGAARALYAESLAIFRQLGNKQGIAWSILSLGNMAREQGDYGAARAFLEESLAIFRELGDKLRNVQNLEGLAAVAVAQVQPERAARLFGAAEGLREAIGAPLPPADRAEHDRSVAAATAALGEEAFAAAWAEGRAMTWEQAVECALEDGADG